jgi:catechol 2,3-dioxygenase-like lactoylglutathione lyase family enzyme
MQIRLLTLATKDVDAQAVFWRETLGAAGARREHSDRGGC